MKGAAPTTCFRRYDIKEYPISNKEYRVMKYRRGRPPLPAWAGTTWGQCPIRVEDALNNGASPIRVEDTLNNGASPIRVDDALNNGASGGKKCCRFGFVRYNAWFQERTAYRVNANY